MYIYVLYQKVKRSVHCDSYLLIIYFINPINSFHITYVYYNLPRKKEILTSFLVFSPYIFTHAPLNYKEKNLIKICRANFRRKKEGVFAFNTGHHKLLFATHLDGIRPAQGSLPLARQCGSRKGNSHQDVVGNAAILLCFPLTFLGPSLVSMLSSFMCAVTCKSLTLSIINIRR